MLHSEIPEFTFFFTAYKSFTEIQVDLMLGHKTGIKSLQKFEIILRMLSDHYTIKIIKTER